MRKTSFMKNKIFKIALNSDDDYLFVIRLDYTMELELHSV